MAAFPAYSVALVIASGLLLLALGLVGGFAGKRWRARRLARARRLVAQVAEPVLPTRRSPGDDGHDAEPAEQAEQGGAAHGTAWPTGRHARRERAADPAPGSTPAPEEPAARDAA